LVSVDVLEPEDEVVGGERLAVAPLHAAAQVHEPGASAVLHLEAPGEVRQGLVARVVPEHQMVRPRAAAEPVPEVRRAREAGAPRAAVLADLLQRFDDQRILADSLGHRRQLARLDELGELRRLLERLGGLRGVGDDLRAFELADVAGGLAAALRERARGDGTAERPDRERERESGSEHTLQHEGWSPFTGHRPGRLSGHSPGKSRLPPGTWRSIVDAGEIT